MKLVHYLPLALLPLLGLATPTPGWDDHTCLSDADAILLVDVMVSLSVKFDPAYVTQFMTDDFYLQSDSIVSLLLPAMCGKQQAAQVDAPFAIIYYPLLDCTLS